MTDLDTFETALLAELRREVREHPAPAPTLVPARRPRRRLRLAAVSATGVAASVVAVFGLGGTGGSPAYAVEENGAGDVIVTVHRLDDAAGLEKALAGKGIDAAVSYDADGPTDSLPGPLGTDGPAPSGQGGVSQPEDGTGSSTGDPAVADNACGPVEPPPATLAHEGEDWVLTIPAGSPLHDRHVDIGTNASGTLVVLYASSVPGLSCGVTMWGTPGTQ